MNSSLEMGNYFRGKTFSGVYNFVIKCGHNPVSRVGSTYCSELFPRLAWQMGVLDFLFLCFGTTVLPFKAFFRTGCCSLVECGVASIEHQSKTSVARADLSPLFI